ncbi:uncharacterized protein LOC109811256 isoform X1 [Cajanus cajan]|uniref:uncharacterized protein LOC109811256 isoform X1 n=2 Tax=Cajanus cajan TaxID=3821 RepID=UPI00098DBA08|nr:uncharacterized protein LOC109811256 isoform X1 [Cajanus cajan]
MSIRTNPMKAVPSLLRRLRPVEKQENLKSLKSELIHLENLFSTVKKNEEELLDVLTAVDGYIRNSNIHKLMEEEESICQRIRDSTQKLLPPAATQSSNIKVAQSSEKATQSVKRKEVKIPQPEELERFKVCYEGLDDLHKHYFLSLLLLPENAVIKKRNVILWWAVVLGHDSVPLWNVFMELKRNAFIVPHAMIHDVNKFKLSPCIRHMSVRLLLENDLKQFLEIDSKITPSSHCSGHTRYECLALYQKKVKLSDELDFKSTHWRAIFNVGAKYLNFGNQWMAKMKRLEVLQLGCWLQDSTSHDIEVESEEFLKELRGHKYLKYLSLCGISGISKLPPSIFQLESLETLDLKACHNLETLPNDIASLRNLKHLDLSNCYLLDRMPKGIEKLTELQVLKGIVIGRPNKTPCKISDLANLKNLERLSIHIGRGAVIQEREFESLIVLSKLEHLKISWGVSDTKYSDIQITLPSSLTKLHLEGFPGQEIPEWLKPSKLLERLKVLNITGGNLKSMNHGENNNQWCVEIVRLKYLKHLKVDLTNLQELFPSLKHTEIKHILNHSYLEWSLD